jgi:8-amino-7-oxononanoate synthase
VKPQRLVDFSSALYLGFQHGSRELRPWSQFTTGMPAALRNPVLAQQVARDMAGLQGCERATLATSTLHVFWDLCAALAGVRAAIYLDRGTYPVAWWGVERAAARGIPARVFGHHDVRALEQGLAAGIAGRRPVIVADGFCPSCGLSAPVAEYLALAREYGGYLVLDDTQALGIFGQPAGPAAPYGKGGGGMLRRANAGGPEVVLVSSMAKAFGVPIAVLSGPDEIVEQFESHSETRMHCSPPSIASLHAAELALAKNREAGDRIRFRLAQLVGLFRDRIRQAGHGVSDSLFPVQPVWFAPGVDVTDLYRKLLQRGIRGVLHRQGHGGRPGLSFVITARHTVEELTWTAEQLSQIARPVTQGSFISR